MQLDPAGVCSVVAVNCHALDAQFFSSDAHSPTNRGAPVCEKGGKVPAFSAVASAALVVFSAEVAGAAVFPVVAGAVTAGLPG